MAKVDKHVKSNEVIRLNMDVILQQYSFRIQNSNIEIVDFIPSFDYQFEAV